MPDELILFEKMQRGDTSALEYFFREYTDVLYYRALGFVKDNLAAEDIVQETFLKLWQIREKLDGYNSVEALAVQVAKNLALDKLKQHRPEGMDIALLSLDSGTRNPAEELEQHDTVARIRWLISKLPSLQQTIIRMKDIEGYELAEIAEITATPVENVRVNLSRARKKIREQFLQLNKQEKWT